ncbi:hypothetical protein AB6A40_010034 [Gnathostoma spinigerum]|uniref:Cytochrome b561 domain-containing protein n=1 Tax=Gnathostoma spinigerum TaxID=75299 RepID=A0ABD6F2M3_9BILA
MSVEATTPTPSAETKALISWKMEVNLGTPVDPLLIGHVVNSQLVQCPLSFVSPGSNLFSAIHQYVNYFTLILMLFGLTLLFVSKGIVWEGPWFGRSAKKNLSAGAWHSFIGAISLLLAFIQPFVAIVRGSPQSKNRYIFRWTHRIIGLMGLLLALIAVLITVIKFKMWWSELWATVLFVFYLFVLVVFVASAELIRCKKYEEKDASFEDDKCRVMTSGDSLILKLFVITIILAVIFTTGLSIDMLVS